MRPLLLALAAPLVSAIAFTDPALNATLTKDADYQLTWASVDTDPTAFSIYLVNFVDWPPYYTPLALDVDTALGAYTVRVPCAALNSYGFQFNAINGTNVYVIYAQTPKFFVAGAACIDPPASSCAAAAAAAATVTVTVSNTLSSSLVSGNGSYAFTRSADPPTSPSRPSSGSPSTFATSHHRRPKPTFGAKCPDTIGWGESGYRHPVTLTKPPIPPGRRATATIDHGKAVYTTVYRK